MTNSPDEHTWHIEHAKRSLRLFEEEAIKEIRSQIAWVRQRLDEAERALDAGHTPSSCGVIQSAAGALDLAVGRLCALRDVRPAVDILTGAPERTAKEGA